MKSAYKPLTTSQVKRAESTDTIEQELHALGRIKELSDAFDAADYKASVRLATTGVVDPLAAPATVDGKALAVGDRILRWNAGGAASAGYGVYEVAIVGTGADGIWQRALDFLDYKQVSTGATIYVEDGGTLKGRSYTLQTVGTIIVGTTTQTWGESGGAGYVKSADIGSTANGKGASLVGIEDAAVLYAATNVETALAEARVQANLGVSDAAAHAARHVTGGGDTIADAIAAGNSGLMSGADKTKLDGVEALADVTDTANVATALGTANAAAVASSAGAGDASKVPKLDAAGQLSATFSKMSRSVLALAADRKNNAAATQTFATSKATEGGEAAGAVYEFEALWKLTTYTDAGTVQFALVLGSTTVAAVGGVGQTWALNDYAHVKGRVFVETAGAGGKFHSNAIGAAGSGANTRVGHNAAANSAENLSAALTLAAKVTWGTVDAGTPDNTADLVVLTLTPVAA